MLELSVFPLDYSSKAGVVAADTNWTALQLGSQVWLEKQCPKTRVVQISFDTIDGLDRVAQSCIIEGHSEFEVSVLCHSSLHQLNATGALGHHQAHLAWTGRVACQRTVSTMSFIDEYLVSD